MTFGSVVEASAGEAAASASTPAARERSRRIGRTYERSGAPGNQTSVRCAGTSAGRSSLGEVDAEPDDRQRHEEDRAVEHVPGGAADVDADEQRRERDERELDVQRAVRPAVGV